MVWGKQSLYSGGKAYGSLVFSDFDYDNRLLRKQSSSTRDGLDTSLYEQLLDAISDVH